MFIEAKMTSYHHLESDSEGLFHTITTTTIDTYKDIVSKELIGFLQVFIDVKSCKCALFWRCKENTQIFNHYDFSIAYYWHPNHPN
jgi:hypothetical protein